MDKTISGNKQRKRKSCIDPPEAYVSGKCLFMGNMFYCDPSTLIPRKDTEILVKKTLDLINNSDKHRIVLEIGVGSGNISVSLALKNDHITVYGSDISKDALTIARKNILLHCLEKRVFLYHGDMFSSFEPLDLKGKVDIVISNPPYIPDNKMNMLPEHVIDHEPHIALKAGSYGMNVIRKLIKESPKFLRKNGYLYFEFGSGQDKLVKRLIERNGHYSNICFYTFENVNRFVSAQYTK